jgi:uncharacterized protein (UPF0262 family)
MFVVVLNSQLYILKAINIHVSYEIKNCFLACCDVYEAIARETSLEYIDMNFNGLHKRLKHVVEGIK